MMASLPVKCRLLINKRSSRHIWCSTQCTFLAAASGRFTVAASFPGTVAFRGKTGRKGLNGKEATCPHQSHNSNCNERGLGTKRILLLSNMTYRDGDKLAHDNFRCFHNISKRKIIIKNQRVSQSTMICQTYPSFSDIFAKEQLHGFYDQRVSLVVANLWSAGNLGAI